MLGPLRLATRLLLLAVTVALMLEAFAPLAIASAPAPGITITLASDGSVSTGLETVVSNGSSLRGAMDGYFGPLIETLPGTNATRAALLAEINATESNPFTAGLFGSRSGRVDSGEVAKFQNLILSEAKLLPLSDFTGLLNVTMDGRAPLSDQLQGIAFTNAPGLDNSSAAMGVVATLYVVFSWSGVGSSHVFQIAWNLPAILGNLSIPLQPVNLSFATPQAVTITSVTGLLGTQISNDPFGYGSASASGQYTPLPGHTIVIRFGPSFPTGDVLIGGLIGAAVVATVAVVLLRRRRRQRAVTPPGAPASPSP
ncbi:MAG: hypothetical protein WCB18_08745 [Thermoplasmata archaeon]